MNDWVGLNWNSETPSKTLKLFQKMECFFYSFLTIFKELPSSNRKSYTEIRAQLNAEILQSKIFNRNCVIHLEKTSMFTVYEWHNFFFQLANRTQGRLVTHKIQNDQKYNISKLRFSYHILRVISGSKYI